MAATIAVTGATGAVGGRVAELLRERGTVPRLVVRDPARAPEGFADVRSAEYADGDAMRGALAGVETVLLVSAGEAADRARIQATAVAAAAAAGVRRIVYLSFLAAAADATFTFARDHWATELEIREAVPGFVFLRDSLYQDFAPGLVGPDGAIRGPAGDGRVALVAREDVARAAAAVLLEPEPHDGASYDLTGPESLSMRETAIELSGPLGLPVHYSPESLATARERLGRAHPDVPEWEREGWVTSYAAIATGELDIVSPWVETLTGRPPRRLQDTLRDERIPLT